MAEPTPFRIGLDGYNLALARGTGVATYGRVLGETLTVMGHPLDGVFGLTVPAAAAERLGEILFFDALGRDSSGRDGSGRDGLSRETLGREHLSATLAGRRPSLGRLARRAMLSPLPRRAVQLPQRGGVVARGLAERLPPFSRLFTLSALFEIAPRYFRRYRRFLPLRIADPPAVMHWTYPLPIRLVGARNVYTIHDLVPLRLPQASLEDKRYHHRLVQACLARGDHVCTVSEASRRDILELFPTADPTRVTNTYQAVSTPPDLMALEEDELARRLRNLFGLQPQGYLLFFGAIEPKKNVGRLIEAYLGAEIETPLVIVGASAWMAEGELRLLSGAHGQGAQGQGIAGLARIRRLDYLPRPLLQLLARGARVVVFPSLYEGFGLPVAEAMGLGAPVLTSTTSSLPEIAGDAALLVDPYDIAALAAALRRLDGDADLRARLAAAGPGQAARFSIPAYAERLGRLYGQVMAEAPRAGTAAAGRTANQTDGRRPWPVQTSEAMR